MTFFPAYFFAVVYWKAWMTSPSNSSCKRMNQPRAPEHEGVEGSDLFGRLGNVPRSSSESKGKDDVGWAENAVCFRPVGERSGHVDNPGS